MFPRPTIPCMLHSGCLSSSYHEAAYISLICLVSERQCVRPTDIAMVFADQMALCYLDVSAVC